MSSFFSASSTVINDGIFSDNSTDPFRGPTGPSGIDTLLTASGQNATRNFPPPRCSPGTRDQFIQEINAWALSKRLDLPPLLWLQGSPGIGKSSIAHTCFERLKEKNIPCAAFFFSIGNGSHSDPKRLFPSIAYQLCTIFPEYCMILDKMLRTDRSLVDKSLQLQLQNLIIEPLRLLRRSGRGVAKRIPVFVDGLDECASVDAQRAIIDLIAQTSGPSSTSNDTGLCWALFSRPEAHLEGRFSRADISNLTHKIALPISYKYSEEEIGLFVRMTFREIVRNSGVGGLEVGWPGEENVRVIVKAAKGMFLYAAAVLRFVGGSDLYDPADALVCILKFIRKAEKKPKSHMESMNALYGFILSRIPAEMESPMRLFLTLQCISLDTRRSAILWNNFLRVSRTEFRGMCRYLGAVVHFEEDPRTVDDLVHHGEQEAATEVLPRLCDRIRCFTGGSVWFYHRSFIDFLMDVGQSGSWYAMSESAFEGLYTHATKLWVDYDKNVRLPTSEWSMSSSALVSSPSPLSNPHPLPFVNLVVIGDNYEWLYDFISHLVDSARLRTSEINKALIKCDFRKALLAKSRKLSMDYDRRVRCGKCSFRISNFGGSRVLGVLSDDFEAFDIDDFKDTIKRRRDTGMIKPYSGNVFSRIKSLGQKPKLGGSDSSESGLYEMGKGDKGIVWFWEVNREMKYALVIESPSMDEAMRGYEDEKIESWLKNRSDRGRKSMGDRLG